MNKIKIIACTTLLCMGMAVSNVAFGAESSEMNSTSAFTLEDVQKLVVHNNPNLKKLQISLDNLDLSKNLINDQKSDLNSANYSREYILNKMASLEEAINAGDADAKATYEALSNQLASMPSTDTVSTQKDSLNDSLTDVVNNAEDLAYQQKVLKPDLEMTASALYTKILETENTIELLEKNLELAIKSREITQIQIENGLATEHDYLNANITVTQLSNQLTQAKTGLTTLKRTLNDLMGRDMNAPLKLAEFTVDQTIYTSPLVNASVVEDTTNQSYTLYQLERELKELKQDRKDADTASERREITNKIELKQLEIDSAKVSVDKTLKAKADNISTTANTLRAAQNSYSKATQDLEYAKLKYDLGMISQIEYLQQEAATLESKNTLTSAEYAYYYARLEFDYYKNGIPLDNYSSIS